ncbi:MAG: PDZ domain-containing protein, partial [Phycisphaerales bacterium]|nr:PDZ domain-containing protein [Phycisphaerales bacterium]
MRKKLSIRLLVLAAVCLSGVSVSAGQAGRYLAVFGDGSRLAGDDLSGWGQSPAAPRLSDKPLDDPKRQLRWFQDRSLSAWKAMDCTSGYVEFRGGDRLVGQAIAMGQDGKLLSVRPAYGQEMPRELGRGIVRVSARFVRRIVWGRQPYRAFQASTIFLRDGGRLRFTSLRWYDGGVRVLLEKGLRRIPVNQLAEIHMPPADQWETYLRELAVLNPTKDQTLCRLETADGMILTCSNRRFKAVTKAKKGSHRKHSRANPIDNWYHMAQPAWSADAIWVPFNRIAMRTYFQAHRPPLWRFTPDSVVQKSMTGFPWRWRANRNVRGDRMMISGRSIIGGLGVHANNELTFTLPDYVRTFRTRVALDGAVETGGCVRALVYLDSTKSKPLYRSDIIVGSGKVFDSGLMKIPQIQDRPRRLILVADAAHAGRPAGADPLDIRDMLDWIDPVLEFDRAKLRTAVISAVLSDVAAWKGWDVSLAGDDYIPMRSRWDASDPAGERFVHGLAISGRRLTLKASRRIGPKDKWLKLRVRQTGPPTNAGRIEVRMNGRLAAYLPVGRAGADAPYLIPTEAFLGKDVKFEIVYRPGSNSEGIEWSELALVERQTAVDWRPVRVISAVSQRGVKLSVRDDGSILAAAGPQGKTPVLDTYNVRFASDLSPVTAIRLEALGDASLPRGGPGRQGRAVLSQFRASTVPKRRKTIHGRYVRLSLPGRETSLHVSEVQVFAPPPSEKELLAQLTQLAQAEPPEKLISANHKTADILAILKVRPAARDLTQRTRLRSYLDAISRNIALGVKASQSSTAYTCVAGRAVDGRTESGYTHTNQEQSPWLLLDMGDLREIDRIVVWNREDGNGYERMTGLLVEVLDAKRKTVWRRTEVDSAAIAAEFFDSDVRDVAVASTVASYMAPGRHAVSSVLDTSAYGWSVGKRFGESHAIEFALARPVEVRGTGLDVQLKHAYSHYYAVNPFSDGFGYLSSRSPERAATLGCFRLLVTADAPPTRVELAGVVIEPFKTNESEKGDATVVLTSPHPLFEDTGRFDAIGSGERSKIKLISDDRHSGKRAVRIESGGEYRMNFGRIISIRRKPVAGEFRYIRFAIRKYGAGRVSLKLGNLTSRNGRYEVGRGTPGVPGAQSAWQLDLPAEWIVRDRDICGDFGSMDLTSLTIACSGGGYAVLDHIYLAAKYDDFKRLPPAPSPAVTNLKARRTLAGPILKKGFPAVVLVTVGDRQASGCIVGDEGYVMTVGHMLIGGGKDATIRLLDGRTVKGQVAGVYRSCDVGLVKITDKGPWKGLELSKAEDHARGMLYVGFTFDRAFKGGKAPTSYITDIRDAGYWTYRGGHTQKDAILGGPLLDEHGHVVGMHNGMVTDGGMQFARMRSPRHEWSKLKKGAKWGTWLSGSGPMLGFYSAIHREGCGIAKVYPNTPAAAAGMKPGDVITKVDGKRIGKFEDLVAALRNNDPGDEVKVTFKRGKSSIIKTIRL